MPYVSFGDCLANYWYVWAIDGLGGIFSLLINMAVAFFFMKYFQFIAHGGPSAPKQPASQFDSYAAASQGPDMPVGAWGTSNTMGNVFNAAPI